MSPENRNCITLATLLFVGLIITYSNHFQNGFHFDDIHTIVKNVHIRNIKNIPDFFHDRNMFSASPFHRGIRPMVTTSLAVDYWLGDGLNPFYFHLSTFIWYITLCILLFFVYRKLLSQSIVHPWISYISIIAVGLYALHTVNAETINYIISRSDVLSTFFIVLSFVIYIFYPEKRKWHLYIIPAVIGVFSKETVLVLPILLLFYMLLFEQGLSIGDLLRKKNLPIIFKTLLKLAPLLIVAGAFQAYTLAKAGSIAGLSNPAGHYIMTQPFVWLHYFISFFLPFNLSADTDWTVITNPFDDRVVIGLIFLCLLVYFIFKTAAKKETKPIAFGLIWFIAALLPTSLAPLSEVMNDHRMFFPFIGLTISIVYAISLFLLKHEHKLVANKNYMHTLWVVIFVVLASYAYGTHQRNKVWNNDETLWYDVTIKSPKNGRGLMNYGLTLMAKGNYDEALNYFEKAKKLVPGYAILHVNIGVLKSAVKKNKEAEEAFKTAIKLSPNSDGPYFYYARHLSSNNRYTEAIKNAEKAIEISPFHLEARYILMDIYLNREAWGKLETIARQVLDFDPKNPTALKQLEVGKNKWSETEELIADLKKNPSAEGYLSLSLMYFNKEMYKECIAACNEALKLKPDYAKAYNNICSSYNQMQDYEQAIIACEKAIAIDPGFTLAKNNLNWARQNQNKQ